MKQEKNQTNIGSQTAKEQESVRQSFKSCLIFAIALTILAVIVLYLCTRH